MHLTVHSEGYAELESDALDSIQEHLMEQVDWHDHFRAYGNLISEIANEDLDIHDDVSDILTSHDFYYDVRSRLEELENQTENEGEYWSNNKYELVESLLNEYDPHRDCGTGEAFTKAVERAVKFNTSQELEPAPQVPVIELQRKVTQLEETVATLLQALSMTGRLAGEQFGLAMFSDASKRASEASRNAYQNEVADEQRQTEVEAIFEALGGEL